MLKKFVPLNSPESPSKNPYEIRTFIGGDATKMPEWCYDQPCNPQRPCDPPQNSTISKVLTIEDEIRLIHQKAKQSRLQREHKKKCLQSDEFLACVIPQRTPKKLKQHAVLRERYLMAREGLDSRVHDICKPPVDKAPSVVKLPSPIHIAGAGDGEEEDVEEEQEEGEEDQNVIKPLLATPSCSMTAMFLPPQRLLQLKRPKSGMYHNETEPPFLNDDDMPYTGYNPRVLQAELEAQGLKKYDVIQGKDGQDYWTWNVGLQKSPSELDRDNFDATTPKLDCNYLEPRVYKIPKDLDKTFSAILVFGSNAVREAVPPRKPSFSYFNRPMEIACLFVAFVESFRVSPDFWSATNMDSILNLGEKLHKKSVSYNYKSKDTDFDIIPFLNERNAAIDLKVHFSGPLHHASTEPNIYKALSLYFAQYNVGLLTTKKLYFLIWKRCANSFYIFDPNGRTEQCYRDFKNGKCCLIAVDYVEHLLHLITHYSGLDADIDGECDFHLYDIYFKNFGRMTFPYPKALPKPTRKLWAVVNDSYALIPAGNSGIAQPRSGNLPNASMVIAVLALLYGDIERACLWRLEAIDDLVAFGKAFYNVLLRRLKLKKNHLNIIDLPEKLMLGSFKARYIKGPFLYNGHVTECKNHLDSALILTIKALFDSEWGAGLLQVDNSVLAIWHDNEYFYVFDPFRRGKAGQVLDPLDYLTKGVACLQIHTTFESFCRVLYQKALMIRRGGKFFVHGIKVGCIKPHILAKNHRNLFTRLRLAYPLYPDEANTIVAKRNKKGKLERKYSIQSVPDADRMPEFENAEVVQGLIDDILCDILQSMIEPSPLRSPIYKQAEKVLLRSDKPYLETLKHRIKHERDLDTIRAALRGEPEPPLNLKQMTVEEELQIPSNYKLLPDGTWIIFSSTHLPMVTDDMAKLSGLLSALVTAALTGKYKISTWNSDLLEHALEGVNGFSDEFHEYDHTLTQILTKNVPKISIGANVFNIKVEKVTKTTMTHPLRQVLIETLCEHNRILVICQRYSCMIMKRYNFLYMFIGFACNTVGYREYGSGPACMMRFVELDALLRRIEFSCNPEGCEMTDYVVVTIKVRDITHVPPERYRHWPTYDEEVLYKRELERYQNIRQRKIDKIHFLDDELRKEHERIQAFLTAKELYKAKREARKKGKKLERVRYGMEEGPFEEGVLEGEGAEEEEEEIIELKHFPGKRLKPETTPKYKPRPIVYGYRLREKDRLYKIQGSKSLEGRDISSLEEIKACFFASTLAILYAILRPLNQWSSQRVDRVIDGANTIANRITNMATAYDRVVKCVIIDDYEFDIWTKTFEPLGAYGVSIAKKIERATHSRRYLLLQLSNCTFGIYCDEYYHLFDPYPSMELAAGVSEEEEEHTADTDDRSKQKLPKGVKKYGERNTASWVLFADVDSMIKYINKRATTSNWSSGEYKFHVVDVISFKKAAARTRMLQLLTDLSVPMECKVSQHGEDESAICAHNESLSWLNLENSLPVWSRMNRRNTADRYRNLPVTKLKKFDVEIEGRLWSVWGNLHPMAPVFDARSRGRQYLACCVIACCTTQVYRLVDWSPQLLDTIVISGDRYHRESLAKIKQLDYEFSLEDLDTECYLEDIKFVVHLEHVVFGRLYVTPNPGKMNLAEALMYFFSHFQFGILQCHKRYLGIGRTLGYDGGYFMYDCQSKDYPLFPKGQGASYLLRTKHLQVLLYCIVVTMNIPHYNAQFSLHKVVIMREKAAVQGTTEEEDEEEET